jgi:O-antigen/teichoic acid export membrane protein
MAEPLAAPAPARPIPLTRRATLNLAAFVLDLGVKTAVGLVLTPFLVDRLGAALFGVWEMLSRLAGYLAAVGGRPADALRLVVANRQAAAPDADQRRALGAALVVWLGFFPLGVAAAAVMVWLAPAITGIAPPLHDMLRLATALALGGTLLAGVAAVPESALQGMNLGYKRMELQAALNVIGGAFTAAAVYAGLGLVGVAGAQLAIAAVSGLCFWMLARTYVGWYGVARPTRGDTRNVLGLSAWLSAGDVISKLLLASDVLILGALLSPTVVTMYVLTAYAPRAAVAIHGNVVGAAMPGLGGLLGERQFERAQLVRRELMALTWVFATAAGVAILLWNRSFLTMWVGANLYAGPTVDMLIVLIATQTAFIRADAYIIDAALQSWLRVTISTAAAAVTITLAIALTRAYGLPGLCLGVLAGRTVQTLMYPAIARRCVGDAGPALPVGFARGLVVAAALFAAASALSQRVLVSNWLVWGAGVGATVVLAALAAFAMGLSRQSQHAVLRRAGEVLRRPRPRPGS